MKVGEVRDLEIKKLFDELRQVTGIDHAHYTEFTVLQYLQQCVYPNGHTKAVRIRRECIAKVDDLDSFVLVKKVGKVGNNLHRLLRGLADTLENHSGTSIYMFLNRTLIPTKKLNHRRYFHRE